MAEIEKLEGLNNLAEISLVNNPVSTWSSTGTSPIIHSVM